MDQVECIVVGAGVVGLAVARALARAGREVLVLESQPAIGTGISARSSEVIHAGIYYPQGSRMARLCVAGREMLTRFCTAHGVPWRRTGKLIVATDEAEAARLPAIAAAARANGVELTPLTALEARRLEPALSCHAALLSPMTGIVDSHGLMLALRGDAEAHGALVALRAPMLEAEAGAHGFTVRVGGEAPMYVGCRLLVNAAGLDAPDLARRIVGLPQADLPRTWLAKGSYFALAGHAPFARLVYPVPVPGGLGVHLTLDLAGQARFGPDIEWVERIDYAVDPARADGFYGAIRRYWPGLPDGALVPAYAGIRPKIVPPDIARQDFRIDGPAEHGVPGLVNLFGIESPGLTASLAIAEEVVAALH